MNDTFTGERMRILRLWREGYDTWEIALLVKPSWGTADEAWVYRQLHVMKDMLKEEQRA